MPPLCLRLLVQGQVLTREPPTGQLRVPQRGRPARRPARGPRLVCWHRLPSARAAVGLPAQGQWRRLFFPPDTNRFSDPLHTPAGCPKNSVLTLSTWSQRGSPPGRGLGPTGQPPLQTPVASPRPASERLAVKQFPRSPLVQ